MVVSWRVSAAAQYWSAAAFVGSVSDGQARRERTCGGRGKLPRERDGEGGGRKEGKKAT